MIRLSSASKRFGSKVLFDALDWLITPGDRIGIVGGNGTGKSTLLKILLGSESLDAGEISSAKDLTIGYLPQDGLSLSGRTVLEECLSAFQDLLEMEIQMEELRTRIAEVDPEGDEYGKVSEHYHRIETAFHARDGYSLESEVHIVLDGLGFSTADSRRRTEEFSGGWQMRIALAKLLLTKPNILLLDEPTNHLDLESRNWLEEYLSDFPSAVVLVSHDRYFLDSTVRKIVELWNCRAHFYTGNYEHYLQQKAARQSQLEAAYRNQRDRIEHLETFINRFRYQATKAKQVQSRIKELEKIERIVLPNEEKTIHFSFPQPSSSGRVVAEFREVAKSYESKQVFSGVSFVINRGDRIALVGVNGAGKSTLIKLLTDPGQATSGECRLGHNVTVDYFAQDQYKALNPTARLLDDLSSLAPSAMSGQTELRTLLGCFLFSGDDVFKPIGVLSGGERNRYALARMLLAPPNFMLLDEPTNHLDLRAKDVLLEALQDFKGTVVFVSHDRYFIDKLATRVFEIENGSLHEYAGNYEDYLWQKQRQTGAATASDHRVAAQAPALREESISTAKKRNPHVLRKMQERRQELEDAIHRCESEIAAAEMGLANYTSPEEAIRLARLVPQLKGQLETMMQEWEQLSVVLESS